LTCWSDSTSNTALEGRAGPVHASARQSGRRGGGRRLLQLELVGRSLLPRVGARIDLGHGNVLARARASVRVHQKWLNDGTGNTSRPLRQASVSMPSLPCTRPSRPLSSWSVHMRVSFSRPGSCRWSCTIGGEGHHEAWRAHGQRVAAVDLPEVEHLAVGLDEPLLPPTPPPTRTGRYRLGQAPPVGLARRALTHMGSRTSMNLCSATDGTPGSTNIPDLTS